ncbi:acyl-CoA carboxylase subunit epsilon [Labedella populi]|uniref:Acyl-CoA carboxylase subunit epsilon n=2 Tax=Labedella populi TaxID=2498850 RepID=A0A3S4EDE0_9MICO|nr:acyl-CoA carboxylase subunit epsilon [Labedella populi]
MTGRHAAPRPDQLDQTDVTEPATPSPAVRVVSGGATPEEVAAVAVVIARQLEEEAARATTDDGPVRSRWALSQRNLRTPLHPAPGAWRFPWA